LRRIPGASHGRALPAKGGQGYALRAHVERLGLCRRPILVRCTGELPERGRLGDRARGVASLHGRARDDPRTGEGEVKLPELSRTRILVTNDDGIHAPGLEALVEIATQLSSDVWIVAPEFNQSGAGHSLSISRPIRAREINETKFAIEGTPTDCVLFAVKHLLKDRKPDIVL